MRKVVSLDGIDIGFGKRVPIIAEIGVNHLEV